MWLKQAVQEHQQSYDGQGKQRGRMEFIPTVGQEKLEISTYMYFKDDLQIPQNIF